MSTGRRRVISGFWEIGISDFRDRPDARLLVVQGLSTVSEVRPVTLPLTRQCKENEMNHNTQNRWIGLLVALVVATLLGGAAGRPAAAESRYNAQPMVVELLELHANWVQGGSGTDETYILVDGNRVWARDSNRGDRHILNRLSFVFWNSIEITLKEEDWPSPDDTLGRILIYGSDYELENTPGYGGVTKTFREDGAHYTIVYRVRPATREEIGSTLRPSHASGKCLDAPWEQFVVSGATLQQWDCGTDRIYLTQRFRLKPAGSGYYLITGTYNNRHLCLDVQGNSTENGAPVQQANCHGQDNQLWRLVDMGNGQFQIVSKRSSKCLDVAWDNDRYAHSNGARIQQWDCYGPNQLNQLWKIVQP